MAIPKNMRYDKDSSYRESDNDSEVKFTHASLPKYAPFKKNYSPALKRAAYKPRDLLNFTVKAFYSREDDDLNPLQRKSLDNFVQAFNDRKDDYGKVFNNEQLASFQQDMQNFMEYLDGFFFFGRLSPTIELEAGMNTVSKKDPYTGEKWESRTTSCTEDDFRFIRIRLNLGRDDKLHDLEALVGNILHEMIHAWYFYFGCDCAKCDRDSLNTTGHPSDCHGPLFLMLHRLIVSEIRLWDNDSLTDFLADDCPDDEVSRGAKKSHESSIADLDNHEKEYYNPVRSLGFAVRHLVRLTKDDEVVVKPSLIHDQLNYEDKLKGKNPRYKKMTKDKPKSRRDGIQAPQANEEEMQKERADDDEPDSEASEKEAQGKRADDEQGNQNIEEGIQKIHGWVKRLDKNSMRRGTSI
ncbi:hypothetical protein HD806DRAFT_547570 [Xylariaceae sp. AK1471]|nr:hypothetical protein HD806DRAFT_547570 [Xylariaceae sp. AK1471]